MAIEIAVDSYAILNVSGTIGVRTIVHDEQEDETDLGGDGGIDWGEIDGLFTDEKSTIW